MKKLLTLLLLAGLFAACDKTPETDPDEITLSYEDIADKETYSFTAPAAWEVQIAEKTRSASWLTIEPMEGPAGAAELNITLNEANTGANPRSVTVTINSGGKAFKTFTVTQHSQSSQEREEQDMSNFVHGTQSVYQYDGSAQTCSFDVRSNCNFRIQANYHEGEPGWITATQITPAGTNKYTVNMTLTANEGDNFRWVELVFLDDKNFDCWRTAVEQFKGPARQQGKYVEALEQNQYFTGNTQTVQLTVKSNFAFTVIDTYTLYDPADWLTVSTVPSGSDYIVSLTFTANDFGHERLAYLSFEDEYGAVYARTTIMQDVPK